MIAIVDSGSTKAEWCFVENNREQKRIKTPGLNPFFITTDQFQKIINYSELQLPVKKLFFYGAGCSSTDKKDFVLNNLGKLYKEAEIVVESDILGAARALFNIGPGIACILGTGSNACVYNGVRIVKINPSLGYIFGDEGGGVNIGKGIIQSYLKGNLPKHITEKLEIKYKISIPVIIDNVYRKPFPNRYLASFSKFAGNNLNCPVIYDIVYNSFCDFVTEQILKLKSDENHSIGFIGSVAWYFKEVLKNVIENYDLKISVIQQSPMQGLINFHSG